MLSRFARRVGLGALMSGLAFALACASPLAQARPTAAPATDPAAFPSPAECSEGTLVTVVAHLDDDLLFVNPGISDRLHAGWCILTVHLIGGANDAAFSYVLTRERAIRQAYARMAGVRNVWRESTVTIAGKPVHRMVLAAEPRIALYELRLPGGKVRGGRVPLGLLWDEGATISSYPMHADGSGAARYDRASLTATVGELLARATRIYTLNPDAVPFVEHPDHIYAARVARAAAARFDPHAPLRYHLTYVTAALPANVPPAATQAKRDEVASYFAIDGGEVGGVFGEYEWNGDWVARRYAFDRPPAGARGAIAGAGTALVNARTNRCLSSAGPPGARRLVLAACDDRAVQRWHWRLLPSYPGNTHDAALVNAATARCVAERAGRLVEARCDDRELAQRFTPWDFGIVRTPYGHCLGERGGSLSLAACGPLTTAYRWTSTTRTPWTDLRMSGALYGDVSGNGHPGAVYVTRRTDGPGFDVWVARLGASAPATRWYSSVVPFDARSSTPSCRGGALCFDSTRFLLGDFEGTGRADLMAIAPTDDGATAFWLLANRGNAFAAPRLWQRSARAAGTARTQQYVAADFDGDGRADVMAAERRTDDAGFDLWVLASRGATGRAPVRWRADVPLSATTQFLAAHFGGSPRVGGPPRAGLIAAERSGGTLALSRIVSTGHAFRVTLHAAQWHGLRPAFTRLASGRIDASGADGLVALSLREPNGADPALIDVWTMPGGSRFGSPVHAGTIAGLAWADALPAIVTRTDASGTVAAMLALFERTDAPLDEHHFTGGAAALAGCPLSLGGRRLGACIRWKELPSRYSEALRLDRLH